MALQEWWDKEGKYRADRFQWRLFEELRDAQRALTGGTDEIKRLRASITSSIGDQTKSLVRHHVASEQAITAAVAELSETVTLSTNRSTAQIVRGLEGLQYSFSRGLAAVSWRLDDLISQARNISWQLGHPRETSSRELVETGLKSYSWGFWDDARRDFADARKLFAYDPIPWLYGGKIALWIDGSLEEARQLLSEASRYASKVSDAVQAEALLEQAQTCFLLRDAEAAAQCAANAVACGQNNPSVLTASARYLLLGKRGAEAIVALKAAFYKDPATTLLIEEDWVKSIKADLSAWLKETHAKELTPFLHKHTALEQIAVEIVPNISYEHEFQPTLKAYYDTLSLSRTGLLDLRNNTGKMKHQFSQIIDVCRRGIHHRKTELITNLNEKPRTLRAQCEAERKSVAMPPETKDWVDSVGFWKLFAWCFIPGVFVMAIITNLPLPSGAIVLVTAFWFFSPIVIMIVKLARHGDKNARVAAMRARIREIDDRINDIVVPEEAYASQEANRVHSKYSEIEQSLSRIVAQVNL